jgi:16S rRNA (uracil1498-N3)-methyltransferase
MRFLMVRPEQVSGDSVSFTPDQQHYLVRVLRRNAGDATTCVLAGTATLELILAAGPRKSLLGHVRSRTPVPPPPSPALSLAVGLLKGNKLDGIIREITELGLARLIPLQCERAMAHWPEGTHRLERLADLAVAACQQSGNLHPPIIEAPISVEALLARERAAGHGLVMAMAAGGIRPSALTLPSDQHQVLLIGPEGDFTPGEMAHFEKAAGRPITLFGNVLRSETACVVLSTLLLARMGRLG